MESWGFGEYIDMAHLVRLTELLLLQEVGQRLAELASLNMV